MPAYGFLSSNWWQHSVAPVFQKAGVPEAIYAPIAYAESSGNPNAAGDCPLKTGGYGPCTSAFAYGNPTSYGTFQLHQNGGQGTGYTATQLLNPATNAQIAVGPIASAYQVAKAKGLTGAALLIETAHGSGHTIPSSYLVSSYNTYLQEIGGLPPGTPSGAATATAKNPATSGNSAPTYSTGSPLADTLLSASQNKPGLFSFITNPGKAVSFTMTELFGALIGIVFIAAGVWALVSKSDAAKQVRDAVTKGAAFLA